VYKQPENAEEEAQCQEAKASCPVEAIGDDGA
jgi:ferredoxin